MRPTVPRQIIVTESMRKNRTKLQTFVSWNEFSLVQIRNALQVCFRFGSETVSKNFNVILSQVNLISF